MRSLKRNTTILTVALCLAASAFIFGATISTTAAQTKTPTKTKTVTPTTKTKAAEKSNTASKTSVKQNVSDKSKTIDKSKDAAKSKTSSEKIKSTAKTTIKSKEKSTASQPSAAKSTAAAAEKTNQTTKSSQTTKTNQLTKINSSSKKTGSTTSAKSPTRAPSSLNSSPKNAAEKFARQIIVAAASARVRSEPKANSKTVSTADIGKTFTALEENSDWYKIRLENNRSGWISKSVAADFEEEKRAEIYRKILAKYFDKNTKLDFATAAQIAEFLKTDVAAKKIDAADLSFKRLLALSAALRAVPAERAAQNPYKDFLKANEKEIVYSDSSGEWLVRSDIFWELQNQSKDTALGEEIAWTAAQNPLPGECEGYVNCYIYLLRVTEGEYLNYYPAGKYAKKSVQNITNLLDPIVADLKEKKIYANATDISDRAEFNRLLTELRTIISKVPFVEKARAIQQINQIGEGFR